MNGIYQEKKVDFIFCLHTVRLAVFTEVVLNQQKLVYAKVHTCDFGAEKDLTPGEKFVVTTLDTAKGDVQIGAMKYLKSLFEEFEEGKTPEARFAHTMDNIQPMMLNVAADGKAWTEHKIKVSQVLKRNEHTGEGSERIWEYAKENYILPSLEDGCLADDRKDKNQELP